MHLYSIIILNNLIINSKVVHRLKAQLNEFLEPQAQALGSVGSG
jgi:hypothetical protein